MGEVNMKDLTVDKLEAITELIDGVNNNLNRLPDKSNLSAELVDTLDCLRVRTIALTDMIEAVFEDCTST